MTTKQKRGGARLGAFLGLMALAGCAQSNTRTATTPMLPGMADQNPKLTASQVADIQVALGRTLEKRGDRVQAMAAYNEALRQDPHHTEACARLAVLYDRDGRFKDSERLYQQALAARPQDPDLLCNRGYSLYLQRRLPEAEAAFRQVIALAPEHRRAHNNLGLVLAQLDHADEAIAEFRSAGCNENSARTNLAFSFALQGRWQEARAQYQTVLTADPSSARARDGLQRLCALSTKIPEGGTAVMPSLEAHAIQQASARDDRNSAGQAEPTPASLPDQGNPPPASAATAESGPGTSQ